MHKSDSISAGVNISLETVHQELHGTGSHDRAAPIDVMRWASTFVLV